MTLQRQAIERELERFIFDELLEEPRGAVDPLGSGAVDSLGIEQLVEHVERKFGTTIAETEMVRENFQSIPALAGLIASKQAGRRP